MTTDQRAPVIIRPDRTSDEKSTSSPLSLAAAVADRHTQQCIRRSLWRHRVCLSVRLSLDYQEFSVKNSPNARPSRQGRPGHRSL